MPHRPLQVIALKKTGVSRRLSRAQQRYKRCFNKKVRREPTFKTEDYVFIERPHLASIASDAVNRITNAGHNKFLRQTSGQYK